MNNNIRWKASIATEQILITSDQFNTRGGFSPTFLFFVAAWHNKTLELVAECIDTHSIFRESRKGEQQPSLHFFRTKSSFGCCVIFRCA